MINNNVLLSIIIPTYNSSYFLDKSISSVTENANCLYEILVIDDGSTDNTFETVSSLCQSNKNIIYYKKINEGPGIARNFGLQKATGRYVLFLDADDHFDSENFNLLEEAIRNNNFDIACFGYQLVGQDNKLISKFKYNNQILPKDNILDFLENGTIKNVIWNKIYKKNFLIEKDIKFSNLKINEDCLFIFDILLKKPSIIFIDNIFYNHTSDNVNSFTNKVSESHFTNTLKLLSNFKIKIFENFKFKYDSSFEIFSVRIICYLILLALITNSKKSLFFNYLTIIYSSENWQKLIKSTKINNKHKIIIYLFNKKYFLWFTGKLLRTLKFSIQ